MILYMRYGPYICIGAVLAILFVLWAFWGGKNYEFVGLGPLDPDTCGSYTGSIYSWGNSCEESSITPQQQDIPSNFVCGSELSANDSVIDNTPSIPDQFQDTQIQINNNVPDNPPIITTSIQSNQLPSQVQPLVPVVEHASSQQPLITLNSSVSHPSRRSGRFVSRGERLCCQTMERIYGVPFNTIRPNWLCNPETGCNLELDCYNDELKIAVEYNGAQHYKWPNFTNQTYQQFINQVRRDKLKMDLCDRNGVYLIVVPYNVPPEKISSFIISHLPETLQKRIHEENIQ